METLEDIIVLQVYICLSVFVNAEESTGAIDARLKHDHIIFLYFSLFSQYHGGCLGSTTLLDDHAQSPQEFRTRIETHDLPFQRHSLQRESNLKHAA